MHITGEKMLKTTGNALLHVHRFLRHKELSGYACHESLFESSQAAAVKC